MLTIDDTIFSRIRKLLSRKDKDDVIETPEPETKETRNDPLQSAILSAEDESAELFKQARKKE